MPLRADDGDCIPDTQVRLSVQAARDGVLVSPGGVLRAARISVSRARVEHRGRWPLLVDLRRSKAKRMASVRLVPRHGRARTLRLPVLGCGRVAPAQRGGVPVSTWLSRHCTSLPAVVAQ